MYGVDEAVFIHNLYWWIAKNEANGRHYYDGRSWTYNSMEAFSKLFPFWSRDQIKRMVKKLKENGAIHIGNYNQKGFDNTNWYALSEEVLEVYRGAKSPYAWTKSPYPQGEIALTIPDSKPDINTDNIPPLPPKGNEFDLFWKAYPKKKAKGDAEKAWKSVKADKHIDAILLAVEQQKQSPEWLKDGGQFIPHPATWLRGKRWEDSEPDQDPPPEPPPPPEINWGGDSIEDRLGVRF